MTESVTTRLIGYGSVISHCGIEKAAKMAGVKMRLLEVDENNSVRGETLKQAMEDDRKEGLVPFYMAATLGTTVCCSFDKIAELGELCQSEGVWMHIDAAYAGAAFICPEFRPLLNGVEYADSFNFSPHKWLLVNIDCSALWVRNQFELANSFHSKAVYVQVWDYQCYETATFLLIYFMTFSTSTKVTFLISVIGKCPLGEDFAH